MDQELTSEAAPTEESRLRALVRALRVERDELRAAIMRANDRAEAAVNGLNDMSARIKAAIKALSP